MPYNPLINKRVSQNCAHATCTIFFNEFSLTDLRSAAIFREAIANIEGKTEPLNRESRGARNFIAARAAGMFHGSPL